MSRFRALERGQAAQILPRLNNVPAQPRVLLNRERGPYRAEDRALLNAAHAYQVSAALQGCPARAATPLTSAPALAERVGVRTVLVKDESNRMGLGSFKALGGAYAVARLLVTAAEQALGRPVSVSELVSSPDVRAVSATVTVTCASAGNHGLSVAAGARLFGAHAVVWLGAAVPQQFADRLAALDARVERVAGDYAQSMLAATAAARDIGWQLVADSSWPGYEVVPLEVMRGYSMLVAEAADEMDASGGPATHVLVQAGVGGLAAAVAGHLRDRWGEQHRLIVVEPEGAACLLASAQAGQLTCIQGEGTALGRLDCLEPSLLAWQLLRRLADAFITVSDAAADDAARLLGVDGLAVSACGAAGAAGLVRLAADPVAHDALGLDSQARVLLFGTESMAPEGRWPA